MFVTIWMCTHEWSLISSRATAFTFATCHQPFSCLSPLTRSISAAQLAVAALGDADAHLLDRLRRRHPRLVLGLLRGGLLDPLLGLLVDERAVGAFVVGHASSLTPSQTAAGAATAC